MIARPRSNACGHETHLLPVAPSTLTTTAPVDWPDTLCCRRPVAALMLIHHAVLHVTGDPAVAWCTYPAHHGLDAVTSPRPR